MTDDHRPQVGPYDVAPAALTGDGRRVDALLASLGPGIPPLPPETPPDGWRVLARDASGPGSVVIGTPVDEAGTDWRIAHVRLPSEEAPGRSSLSPDTVPLRRSVAERRAGLALRWPAVTRELLDLDALSVDIVNEGTERWLPDGDVFRAMAVLSPVGRNRPGFFFGWHSGGTAMPLDPGEYARVVAELAPDSWRDARPGPYRLFAMVPDLRLRSAGLPVAVTQELIDAHRPVARKPDHDGERDRRLTVERLQLLRVYRRARDAFPQTVDAIRDAPSDRTAIARIRELLDCDESAAQAVYAMQPRRLRVGAPDLLAEEIASLERTLATDD